MNKLPDLHNDEAMLKRGRRSAIGSARNEALAALRDACTYCNSAEWSELAQRSDEAIAAAERLKTVAALWQEFGT